MNQRGFGGRGLPSLPKPHYYHKGLRPTRRPPKMKNLKTYKNHNLQKLIVLEGFMQNGLQNRNQRNFLRRTSCVKIDFRHLFDFFIVFIVNRVFECLICYLLTI